MLVPLFLHETSVLLPVQSASSKPAQHIALSRNKINATLAHLLSCLLSVYTHIHPSIHLHIRTRICISKVPHSLLLGFWKRMGSIAYSQVGHTFDQTLDLHVG